jgi:DNA-binding MarR family transcriptional regulator
MAEEQVINSLKNLAYEIIAYREKQLKTENISFSGMFMLSYIAKRGPQKLSDLAVRMEQTKSSITYVVDALERRGYLKREYDENDRRVIWVKATDKAMGLFSIRDRFEKAIVVSLSEIDPIKQEAASEVIDRIAESINSERTRDDLIGRTEIR